MSTVGLTHPKYPTRENRCLDGCGGRQVGGPCQDEVGERATGMLEGTHD